MNQAWLYTLISVLLISLVSFVGVFTLTLKLQTLKKILLLFVSFSAGTLLGGVFFQLIPEAIETQGITSVVSFSIIFGIIFFFILEKIICWRHCHRPTTKDHPHPFAINNLIGDAFHNFIDGVIIAASYSINLPLGLITSTAVLFHEIPQEIGDFGVLIYGGFSPIKALSLNFLSAITALLGAILTLALNAQTEIFSKVLVPFTAGGFIYIALSDLIPELHKETNIKKSLLQLACLSLGLFIMFILTFIGH
jgi:zinc and cadmium transporter